MFIRICLLNYISVKNNLGFKFFAIVPLVISFSLGIEIVVIFQVACYM